MPDGNIVKGVPKGMSKEALLAKYEASKGISKAPTRAEEALDTGTELGKNIFTSPLDTVKGAGEFLLQGATGLASTAAGTVVGATQYLGTMGKENGLDTMAQIQEAGTYMPRTDQGKRASKLVETGMGAMREYGQEAGDAAFEAGAPPWVAATINAAVGGSLDVALAAVGIRGIRANQARTAYAHELRVAKAKAEAENSKLAPPPSPEEFAARMAKDFNAPDYAGVPVPEKTGTIDYTPAPRETFMEKPPARGMGGEAKTIDYEPVGVLAKETAKKSDPGSEIPAVPRSENPAKAMQEDALWAEHNLRALQEKYAKRDGATPKSQFYDEAGAGVPKTNDFVPNEPQLGPKGQTRKGQFAKNQRGAVDPVVFAEGIEAIASKVKGVSSDFVAAFTKQFGKHMEPHAKAVYELWQEGRLNETAKYAKDAMSASIKEADRVLKKLEEAAPTDRPGGFAMETLGANDYNKAMADVLMSDIPKRVVSHEETIAAAAESAQRLGFGPAKINQLAKQTNDMNVRVVQAGDYIQKHLTTMTELAHKAKNGDAQARYILGDALLETQTVLAAAKDSVSNIGRALEATKILKSEGRVMDAALAAYDALGGAKKIDAAIEALTTLKGPALVKALEKKPSWMGAGAEAYTNLLLSSFLTPARNISGNVIQGTWMVGERYTATAISKLRGQGAEFSEANAYVGGMANGIRDAAVAMLESWKRDEQIIKSGGKEFHDPLTTLEFQSNRQIVPELLPDRIQGTWFAKGFGGLGQGIRVFGRNQMAADSAFKSLAYSAELNYQAIRHANALLAEGKITKSQIADTVNHTKLNPTKAIHEAALANARRATFTTPLGTLGKNIQAVLGHHDSFRFVVPFFRTPVNLTKETFRGTPWALLDKNILKGIKEGGEAGNKAAAHVLMGTTLATYAFMLALEGDIEGAAPTDAAGREWFYATKKIPYSIQTPNGAVGFSSIAPQGNMVMGAADLARIWHRLPGEEKKTMWSLFVTAMSNQLINQTYAQGISNALLAATNPDQFGYKMNDYVNTITTPRLVAQVARNTDPIIRSVSGTTPQELELPTGPRTAGEQIQDWATIQFYEKIDQWKRDIPGQSKDLPTEWDYVGRAKDRATAWISPFMSRPKEDHPVILEMEQLKLAFSPIKPQVEGAKLDKYQESKLQQYTGYYYNKLARETLQHSAYINGTPAMKKLLLSEDMKAARMAGAGALLIKEPGLQLRVSKTYLQKAQELLGIGDQGK